MAGSDLRWLPLATAFPVGLDTQTEQNRLRDGFSPDAYGIDPDAKGRLKAVSSIPAGQAAIAKTHTIGANTWTWFYRRCWRANSTTLEYLAPLYQDTELYQDLGKLSFTEDAQSIVTFLPMGGNDLYVGKSTGGYVVRTAASFEGRFQHGDIVPSMKVSAAANAVTMDGVVYVSNGFGLMAWDGRESVELTRSVRDIVDNFQNVALTQDAQRKWIVGTDTFVYDTEGKKLFRYDSTNFRYTTRQLSDEAGTAFAVDRIGIQYNNTTGSNTEQISLEIRRDKDWVPLPLPVMMRPQVDERVWREVILDEVVQSRKFQVRVTAMSSGVEIRGIYVNVDSTLKPGWPE